MIKTILVVEDETSVREVISRMLESKGYNVFSAPDAVKGEAVYRKYGDAISLVITDIVLPEGSGKELYERLRKLNGKQKFLFISAYPEYVAPVNEIQETGKPFLQKPFSLKALVNEVEYLLKSDTESGIFPSKYK